MSDFGNIALLLLLPLTLYASVLGFLGGARLSVPMMRSAERAMLAAWGLCALAMAALWTALIRSDFRVEYVWAHSNRDLPLFYKVTSLWSGQEGSLLLWTFVVLSYGALVVVRGKRDPILLPYVIGVIASSAFFFVLLNNFVANPFQVIALVQADGTILPPPTLPVDGNGLNPLLQHPAMGIHPPVLYGGYVGFLVPFAYCIAALLRKRLGDGWIHTTRRWTLVAWLLQGSGILLGARWAYVELGWGGYWAWDPVENASLMPWLVGTAFLHSVMIQEKRGMLKVWNVALVLMTYGLAIFGTFTTRSGIMSSVHAFAQSSIGGWFVGYLVVLVMASVALLLSRLEHLKTENHYESMVSREAAFLYNNLLFLAACFAVLWGTMFPVLSEAFTGEKIVVGAPFFDRVEVPLALALVFLMGVGPVLAWRKTSARMLWRNFAWPLGVALAAVVATYAYGVRHGYALTSFGLVAFVAATIVIEFWRGGRARARSIGEGFVAGLVDLVRRNKRRYGGYTVHFAFLLCIVGFTGKAFDRESKVPIQVGDNLAIGAYQLHVANITEADESSPNYSGASATLTLTRAGKWLAELKPESRFYHASEQMTTEVSRWGNLREDVYAVYIRGADGRSPEVQLFVKPLVAWLWIGGALMALGTLFTLIPNHRSTRPGVVADAAAESKLDEVVRA